MRSQPPPPPACPPRYWLPGERAQGEKPHLMDGAPRGSLTHCDQPVPVPLSVWEETSSQHYPARGLTPSVPTLSCWFSLDNEGKGLADQLGRGPYNAAQEMVGDLNEYNWREAVNPRARCCSGNGKQAKVQRDSGRGEGRRSTGTSPGYQPPLAWARGLASWAASKVTNAQAEEERDLQFCPSVVKNRSSSGSRCSKFKGPAESGDFMGGLAPTNTRLWPPRPALNFRH